MSERKIFCYRLNEDKLKWYKDAAAYLGFKIIRLSDDDLNIRISELIKNKNENFDSNKYSPTNELAEEIILFADFPSEMLSEILSAYKASGLEKTSLKAVLTETNINWTFKELYNDISDEHAYMQKIKEQNK